MCNLQADITYSVYIHLAFKTFSAVSKTWVNENEWKKKKRTTYFVTVHKQYDPLSIRTTMFYKLYLIFSPYLTAWWPGVLTYEPQITWHFRLFFLPSVFCFPVNKPVSILNILNWNRTLRSIFVYLFVTWPCTLGSMFTFPQMCSALKLKWRIILTGMTNSSCHTLTKIQKSPYIRLSEVMGCRNSIQKNLFQTLTSTLFRLLLKHSH